MNTHALRGYNIPDPAPKWTQKANGYQVDVFDMRGDRWLVGRIAKDGKGLEGLILRELVTEDPRDFAESHAAAIVTHLLAQEPPATEKLFKYAEPERKREPKKAEK